MTLALALVAGFVFVAWLVFFKFRWLKWSILGGVFLFFSFTRCSSSSWTVYHASLNAGDGDQHTIQLIPRLNELTLVTAVLVDRMWR